MQNENKKNNINKYSNSHERIKYKTHPSKIAKAGFFSRNVGRFALPGERILDVGGGAGIWADIIREQGITSEIYALDISASVLSERNIKDICTVGDMEQLPFDDCFFDRAMFFGSLHHVENTQKALAEAKRVLKPGGYIFLWEPVSVKMRLLRKNIESTADNVEFKLSLPYILQNLEKCGFEAQLINPYGFLSRFCKCRNIRLMQVLFRIEECVNEIPFFCGVGFLADNVVVVAKKSINKFIAQGLEK